MNWKRFYADELLKPAGREAALNALERHAGGDPVIQAALLSGGLASFPHVSIHDSADSIARVVQSIIDSGKRHVVALGVLHGGSLPATCRDAWSSLNSGSPQARDAFPRFAGAFIARGATTTPFGRIDEGALPARAAFIREDAAMLGDEFSLDLFLALLAAAAQASGVRPPAVARVFVSATRSPDGSFEVAQALADEIRQLIDDDTVCVATGDLAHLGSGYSAAGEVAAIPADRPALLALLRQRIRAQHDAALQRRDFAAAWSIGTGLLNDQRHMLPVIAELIGPAASFELLSFSLSDYADINGVPPPCFVAAALGLFRPAAA